MTTVSFELLIALSPVPFTCRSDGHADLWQLSRGNDSMPDWITHRFHVAWGSPKTWWISSGCFLSSFWFLPPGSVCMCATDLHPISNRYGLCDCLFFDLARQECNNRCATFTGWFLHQFELVTIYVGNAYGEHFFVRSSCYIWLPWTNNHSSLMCLSRLSQLQQICNKSIAIESL